MEFCFDEIFNVNKKIKIDNEKPTKKPPPQPPFNPIAYTVSLFTNIKENLQQKIKNSNDKKDETMGYFQEIPEEILIKICKYLTKEELSILAIVNTKFRNFIVDYFLISHSGLTFLLTDNQAVPVEISQEDSQSMLKLFSDIGLLLKRATFLFRTCERISLLIYVIENSFGIPSLQTFEYFNFRTIKTLVRCYGKIINKLTCGWGDFECIELFNVLKEKCKIDEHIQKFLKSSLGSKQKHELLIRNFFRMICTHNETLENFKEKMSWLINTLNIYSSIEISKLFLVIFGPLVTINNSQYSLPYVAWWDLTDLNFVQQGLEDLGLTFYFMSKCHSEVIWNKDYVLKLLEHVVQIPAHWNHTNIATLLYYCGNDLTVKYLNQKMKDGNIQDVAMNICYLNIITHKFAMDLNPILKLIDFLIEEHGEELIEELMLAFSTIIFEMEFNGENDLYTLETADVIDSQLHLMKLSLLKSSNIYNKMI